MFLSGHIEFQFLLNNAKIKKINFTNFKFGHLLLRVYEFLKSDKFIRRKLRF